jgi:hypothetical protein
VAYLTVAVVLVGVLGLLNLALVLALIRSMRIQPRGRTPMEYPGILRRGTKAPEFTTTTVTGQTLSLSDLLGARSVIAFLSVRCPPCRTELPHFVEFARTVPGGKGQVLAVVTGDDAALTGGFAAQLEGVASVVVETRHGPMSTTFSITGSPVFFALDERGYIEAGAPAVHLVASPELV